jgi:hypothetical protein
MVVKDKHSSKQCLSMKVTEFGMEFAVNNEHLAKQDSLNELTNLKWKRLSMMNIFQNNSIQLK